MEPTSLPSLEDKLSAYLKRHAVDARAVHGLALKLGCLCSTFLCNNLVHAYAARSMIEYARRLFDEIPRRNIVTWSAMISGYTQKGNVKEAMKLMRGMQQGNENELGDDGCLLPNKFTLGSILTGCTRAKDFRTGMQIHCSTVKFGVDFDTFISGALVDMYAKCSDLEASWRVFEQTPEKDVVTWTAMITCLANSGQRQCWNAAFELFKDMICKDAWPVGMTFASLAKIFDEPRKLNQAKQVHGCIIKLGIEVDDHLRSALVAMYGRCKGTDEVVRLSVRLDCDVVSWTSLLVAFMQNGFNIEVIDLFRRMIAEKMVIDQFVIASLLGACSALKEPGMGEEIHGYAMRNGFMLDISVSNAMITLYGRYCEIRKAERVFQLMRNKDVISWTTLLNCYCHNGHGEEALLLFLQVLREGLSPPVFCVTGAIQACSMITSLAMGQQIHSRSFRMGISTDLSVENSLITMYAKCGNIDIAMKVFDSMTIRDTISWNALITGFSHHGLEKETLELFHQMQDKGIRPDDYTFSGLLASCSRAGLVAKGSEYFQLMSEAYGLEPKMEHYACMVDLFGRAGKLRDAIKFINALPCDPDQLVWEALLASCKVHRNMEIGLYAAKKILDMRPDDPSPYIALSNIHASADMYERKAYVRAMMEGQGIRKEPAKSCLEANVRLEDAFGALQVG